MQPNPQIHKTNSSQPAERTTDPYPENTLRQPKVQPQMNVQQSFAHEIPVPAPVNPVYECCLSTAGAILGFFGALPCCCCCPNPFKIVLQGEVGLVTKFGKYYKSVDPGLHQINVLTEALFKLNMKIQVVDIPAQVITTKDNVSVIIDSILYWHIQDPYSAAFLVNDVRQALIERTQTTLRQIMGTRTLQETIEHRDTIADEIQSVIGPSALSWGAKVESILIKDLKFSQDLQENLSAAAKQKRIGESKVIAAQAEVDSAKLLRQAADILSSPAAMQIRYLDTMNAMARNANSKVIFMPASGSGDEDMVKHMKQQMMLGEI